MNQNFAVGWLSHGAERSLSDLGVDVDDLVARRLQGLAQHVDEPLIAGSPDHAVFPVQVDYVEPAAEHGGDPKGEPEAAERW